MFHGHREGGDSHENSQTQIPALVINQHPLSDRGWTSSVDAAKARRRDFIGLTVPCFCNLGGGFKKRHVRDRSGSSPSVHERVPVHGASCLCSGCSLKAGLGVFAFERDPPSVTSPLCIDKETGPKPEGVKDVQATTSGLVCLFITSQMKPSCSLVPMLCS